MHFLQLFTPMASAQRGLLWLPYLNWLLPFTFDKVGDLASILRKIPWRRERLLTPVFCGNAALGALFA